MASKKVSSLKSLARKALVDRNVIAAAFYFVVVLPFGWLISLVAFAVVKDKLLRFHSLQAALFGIAVQVVLYAASIFAPVLASLLGVVAFVAWVAAIYYALKEEEFLIPLVGEVAKKNA
ncbi:MAG: hypothetical protein AABW54_00685 [Candidatus Micrarchaeota archaeon]